MRDCRNRGMQITPEIKRDSICSWLWSACLLFLCIDCGQIDLAIKGRHKILSSHLAKESYASEISSPIFREKIWLKFMKGRGWDDKCIILPAIDYSFIRICIWVNDNQSEDFDLHVLALTWRLFQEKFLSGLNILRLRHIIKTSKKLNLLIAKTVQVLEVKQKDLWNRMLGP